MNNRNVREKAVVAKVRTMNRIREGKEQIRNFFTRKSDGIDGILVTVGLCIIALVLCVVMKDQLSTFITGIVENMTKKANGILAPTDFGV